MMKLKNYKVLLISANLNCQFNKSRLNTNTSFRIFISATRSGGWLCIGIDAVGGSIGDGIRVRLVACHQNLVVHMNAGV